MARNRFTKARLQEIIGDRSLWLAWRPTDDPKEEKRVEVVNLKDANLIGSREVISYDNTREYHWPVLDLDFPCDLIPSSTEGHYHLYLDKRLTWEQYEKVLKVLGEVGILEPQFVKWAMERKQTQVRIPGQTKAEEVKKPKKLQLGSSG
jgi:hypothetical protein